LNRDRPIIEASKGIGPEKGMKIRKVSILFEGGKY
jgi:hypothetical protein